MRRAPRILSQHIRPRRMDTMRATLAQSRHPNISTPVRRSVSNDGERWDMATAVHLTPVSTPDSGRDGIEHHVRTRACSQRAGQHYSSS